MRLASNSYSVRLRRREGRRTCISPKASSSFSQFDSLCEWIECDRKELAFRSFMWKIARLTRKETEIETGSERQIRRRRTKKGLQPKCTKPRKLMNWVRIVGVGVSLTRHRDAFCRKVPRRAKTATWVEQPNPLFGPNGFCFYSNAI
jgi:hypothetical protein